jgi:L-ascorbate metabolism protein UlaG (beta-lactamase superfamily)
MRITWLGHSSFRIHAADKVIYIDPFWGDDYAEPADFILVTHDHQDHNQVDKVEENVTCRAIEGEVDETIDGIQFKSVPAYNVTRFRSPGKPFHPKGFGCGYLITAEGKTVYHAGDTDRIPEMSGLRPDVALLPVGGTFTMDLEEAKLAAKDIGAKRTVPMHYNSIAGIARLKKSDFPPDWTALSIDESIEV